MKSFFNSIVMGSVALALSATAFAVRPGTPTGISSAKSITPNTIGYIFLNKGNLVVGATYNVTCPLTVDGTTGAYAQISNANLGGATLTIDGGTVSTGSQQDITSGAHIMLIANAVIDTPSTPEIVEIRNLDSTATINVGACTALPVV